MRTNGRTSSCGGGASMTTTVLVARVSLKYLRNEASPASRVSRASPQPARAAKWARNLARSDIEQGAATTAIQLQGDAEVLGQEGSQSLWPFNQHDALGQVLLP